MFKTDKGANGKAANANQQLTENFFNQCFVTPHPMDRQQVIIHPLPGSGIPMRDFFAAKAIETAWQESLPTPTGKADWDDIASKAYRIADAMLKARNATVDNKGFPYTDGSL